MNRCFYFSNAYASQLACYKSHCGQFTLKGNIHLPADFTAGSLDQRIQTPPFLKNDNFVTNLSRLYFSTVGWCLFWLTSHCIIHTVHASSWQNSQLKKKIKNSTDDCCNLLCTLYLVSTLHSFSPSPSAISSLFLLLIEKLNICFLKSIWIVKLPIHWHVVGSGCHARVSRHVQWVALCTGSSV